MYRLYEYKDLLGIEELINEYVEEHRELKSQGVHPASIVEALKVSLDTDGNILAIVDEDLETKELRGGAILNYGPFPNDPMNKTALFVTSVFHRSKFKEHSNVYKMIEWLADQFEVDFIYTALRATDERIKVHGRMLERKGYTNITNTYLKELT